MASKRSHRRRRKETGPRDPRFWDTYPYGHGDAIEVELHRSRNGLLVRQLGTLDSLRLHKRGDVSIIRFDRPTTPGMLHAVRHVIHARPTSPANGRTNGSAAGRDAAVSVRTYQASGGDSLLLRLDGDGLLRVEAQRDGFALVWPSTQTLPTYVKTIRSLWWSQDGTATVVADGAREPVALALNDLDPLLAERGRMLRFLRLDFADRSFTWAADYEDPGRAGWPDTDARLASAHEVSFAADRFEPAFTRSLLARTATFKPRSAVDALLERAEPSLRGYLPDAD